MANKTVKKDAKHGAALFETDNLRWMAIGLAVIVLGLLLMAGGKSQDPNQFNASEVYSWRRITLAPILIVGGLVVEIYAIMKKPRPKQENNQA
jgi:hypothetical protein